MVELFRNPRRLLLFLFEAALCGVLVVLASTFRLGVHGGMAAPNIAKKVLLFVVVMQGAFYYAGMYDQAVTRTTRATYERVLRALALGSALLFLFWYPLPTLQLGRGV